MSNDKTTEPKDKEDDKNAGKITFRTFWETFNPGYALAGLSSIILSWLSLRRNFDRTLKDSGANPDLTNLHKSEIKRMYDEAAKKVGRTEDELKAAFAKAGGTGSIKAVDRVKAQFAKERDIAAGIRNPIDMFNKALQAHDKWDAGLKIATVVFIGLGALTNFLNTRAHAEKLNREIEKKDDKQQIGL